MPIDERANSKFPNRNVLVCDVSLQNSQVLGSIVILKETEFLKSWRELTMFGILAWIILGVIAGALAKLIVPGRQGGGFFATSALGIVGAFIGGIIHHLFVHKKFNLTAVLADKNMFDLGSISLAVLGAIIAIFLWGLVMGKAEN
jgi:uncharacterized membrane protein YeaQ/YmgE (transglycosylase-associated protein family)